MLESFTVFLYLQGKLTVATLNPYNLRDLAGWLHSQAQRQRLSNRLVQRYQQELPKLKPSRNPVTRSQTVLYQGSE